MYTYRSRTDWYRMSRCFSITVRKHSIVVFPHINPRIYQYMVIEYYGIACPTSCRLQQTKHGTTE